MADTTKNADKDSRIASRQFNQDQHRFAGTGEENASPPDAAQASDAEKAVTPAPTNDAGKRPADRTPTKP